MSDADPRLPKLHEILRQANDAFLRASWDVVVRRRVALPNLGDQVSDAVFGPCRRSCFEPSRGRAGKRIARCRLPGQPDPTSSALASWLETEKGRSP